MNDIFNVFKDKNYKEVNGDKDYLKDSISSTYLQSLRKDLEAEKIARDTIKGVVGIGKVNAIDYSKVLSRFSTGKTDLSPRWIIDKRLPEAERLLLENGMIAVKALKDLQDKLDGLSKDDANYDTTKAFLEKQIADQKFTVREYDRLNAEYLATFQY
jgi:hypothetical protein